MTATMWVRRLDDDGNPLPGPAQVLDALSVGWTSITLDDDPQRKPCVPIYCPPVQTFTWTITFPKRRWGINELDVLLQRRPSRKGRQLTVPLTKSLTKGRYA